ncbi:hypothetical protein N3K66_006198 [Trichothecium roseum]|uniref:Uncharacterized protein n=1 Tax=Trichothecium roseum TaxID=47278 RepID=A0ACC0V006_9HYPO|nr:hypothetical protein N3K66_006198 [Trichothecium roseum]
MAKLEPFRGEYYLWKYLPSAAAAAVFLVLFLIATLAISWRIWRTRTWFCSAFAVGGLFQVIGYAARIVSRNNTAKLMPYAIQNAFILLSPVLFAASVYMTLSRVIRAVGGERHALFRPARLTRVFVAGDVIAMSVQSGAAGLMVVSSLASVGQGIVVAGLAFHVVVFGVFFVAAALFHVRMRRDPAARHIPSRIQWEQLLRALYVSSGLIMGRSIFRMIEFIMGHDGYLLSTEWPLYVFDAVPMLAVMVVFWWRFPSGVQHPSYNRGLGEAASGDSMMSMAGVSADAPRKGEHGAGSGATA